jgi:hypothetical protein
MQLPEAPASLADPEPGLWPRRPVPDHPFESLKRDLGRIKTGWLTQEGDETRSEHGDLLRVVTGSELDDWRGNVSGRSSSQRVPQSRECLAIKGRLQAGRGLNSRKQECPKQEA